MDCIAGATQEPCIMRFLPIVVILFSMKFPAVAQDGVAPEVCKIVERIKEDERPTWTYEVLAANSDLIVVASLADRQEVAADIVGKTDFDRESTRRFSNKLNVLSVLKGALDTEVHVITTEWAPKTTVLGLKTDFAKLRKRLLLPNLSAVEIDGYITDWGISEQLDKSEIVPEYLLYLKHSGETNRFVPVSGQRWAAASVRCLND